MARLLLTGLLWALLAFVLVGTGALLLPACGIVIAGHRLAWCEVGGGGPSPDLIARLRDLERRAASGPACAPGGEAAIPPPAATAPVTPVVPNAPVVPAVPAAPAPPATTPAAPVAPPVAPAAAPAVPANPPQPSPMAVPASPPQPAAPTETSPPPSAATPPRPEPDRASANTPPAPAPGCTPAPGTPAGATVVLALDHSRSMGLPVDVDPAVIDRLEKTMADGDDDAVLAARSDYNRLIAGSGRKRMDALRDAVASALQGLGPDDKVDAVSFAGCGTVASHGVFAADRRGELDDVVGKLRIRPATPLAAAIERALADARDTSARAVVLVSDGRDTCEGDPCAVARAAGRAIPIHVVAVDAPEHLTCVSEATGGQLFPAGGGNGLATALRQAVDMARMGGTCGTGGGQ